MHIDKTYSMSRILGILTLLIVGITIIACDRNHDGLLDESFETQLVDIVTYTGADDDRHATFRLDGRDDEPSVNLFSNMTAPSNVNKDSRVMLTYAIKHKAPDGTYWDVNVMSLTRIISDSIRVNSNPLDTYSMRPIKLRSAWRTGEFINLHGQVEYTGKNRYLFMMIDRDTRDKDTVQAYLIHDLINTPIDSIYYWRDFYLSVNVGALKSPKSPCHTLRLNINDESNPKVTYYDFNIK